MKKCGVSKCVQVAWKGTSFCIYHQPGLLQQEEFKKKDTINPDHYKQGGIETIDFMKAKMTPVQFEGYLLGNVFKYLSRYQYKNGIEDVRKSQWYLNKLIQTMESKS